MKKEVSAFLISAAATAYYAVTTEGQAWPVVASGVGSNLFLNTFAANNSLGFCEKLLKEKRFIFLGLTFLTAAVFSAPYGAITYLEYNTDNIVKKYIAATFAFLGSFILNGLALKQLSDFANSVMHFLELKFSEPGSNSILEDNIANNANYLMHVLMAMKTKSIPMLEMNALETKTGAEKTISALQIIYNHPALVPSPSYQNLNFIVSGIAWMIQFFVKLGFVIAPLYSALAVACAADVSFQKDFNLNPKLGVTLGNISLSGEDVLSIVGGYALASSVLDVVKNIILFRKVGHNISPVSIASTVLSVFIAFFSGYTAEKQLRKCKYSLMGPALLFLPNAEKAANASSAFFNAIYTKLCLDDVIQYVLKKCSFYKEDDHYSVLKKEIDALDVDAVMHFVSTDAEIKTFLSVLKYNPKDFVEQFFGGDEADENGSLATVATPRI